MKNLEAQERDREAERRHNRDIQKNGLKFWRGAGIFALIITLSAFWLNKEDFLISTLKYLAILFGGGGIGYAVGFRKRRHIDMDEA